MLGDSGRRGSVRSTGSLPPDWAVVWLGAWLELVVENGQVVTFEYGLLRSVLEADMRV